MIIKYPLQLYDELGMDLKPDTEIITGVDVNEVALAENVHYDKYIHLEPGTNEGDIIQNELCLTFSIYWNCDMDNITLDYIEATLDEKPITVHIKTREFENELEALMGLNEEPVNERTI